MPVDRAPSWLTNAEISYRIPGDDFPGYVKEQGLVPPDVVISGGVGNEEVTQRYHDIGTKVISYISFSNRMLDPDQKKDWRFRLADAPELCVYDEKSVRERCIFADSTDPRRLEICPNTEEFAQAMLQEVRVYMESGIDGLFLDHGFGPNKCYGEEFGIHRHIYHEEDLRGLSEEYLRYVPGFPASNDDPLGNYAYTMLLRRAMDVLDEYGDDKIIMLNTTYWPFHYSPRPIRKFVMYAPTRLRIVPMIFWDNAHCCMIESHVTVPKKLISPDSDDEATVRWGDFGHWLRLGKIPQKYIKQGKRQLALPYFGKERFEEVKDDAFYCYAIAKLSNLIWQTSPDTPGGYFLTFKLGASVDADYRFQDGIYYRRYERGMVAVNPDCVGRTTGIEVSVANVLDLYDDQKRTVSAGVLDVKLPPESGRVYRC